MRLITSRIYEIYAVLWTSLFFGPIVYHHLRFRTPEVRVFSRWWAAGILWGLRAITGLRHEIVHHEAPSGGPKLVVANHQSWWETVAFLVLEPHCAIVARRSLAKVPIFGWYLKHSPHILIDREMSLASVRQICREAKEAVAEGRSIVLFPESTRRPPGAALDIKRSVYLIYKELGLPAVPVVHNSGAFLWSGYGRKHPGTVTLEYHAEIPAGLDRDTILEQLDDVIGHGKTRLIETLDTETRARAEAAH